MDPYECFKQLRALAAEGDDHDQILHLGISWLAFYANSPGFCSAVQLDAVMAAMFASLDALSKEDA